jgi:site-specific DNA-cytosine methylase
LLFCEIIIWFILLAGMVVLDNLNMKIDKYYASEVDTDAINVSKWNYGHMIKQVGAVETLNEKNLRSLGRIDLLLGGSPCTELSLANPARKGLLSMYISMYVISLICLLENNSSQWLHYWCCSLVNTGYTSVVYQQGYTL